MSTAASISEAHNSPTPIELLTTSPDLPQSTIDERNRVLQTALSKSRALLQTVTTLKTTVPLRIMLNFKRHARLQSPPHPRPKEPHP